MKKTFLYALVGVLAFSIGLAIFAFRSSSALEASKKVCRKCLDVSKTENLETKTFSEILNDKNFQGRKVRVKALFRHDAGYISLQDLENGKEATPAGFDKNTISCEETEKTLRLCSGYKHWYWLDGSVEITAVGYLGKIDKESNSFQGGEDGFNIICIEQVNATKEEWNRRAKLEKNPFSKFSR